MILTGQILLALLVVVIVTETLARIICIPTNIRQGRASGYAAGVIAVAIAAMAEVYPLPVNSNIVVVPCIVFGTVAVIGLILWIAMKIEERGLENRTKNIGGRS